MAKALLEGCGISKIQSKDGEESVDDFLKDTDVIGIYFSAHWCPPCRGFTPILSKFYKSLRDNNQPIKIIFVSSDQDEASFKEYYGEMPWYALPFDNEGAKDKLSQKYDVSGIPTLVIVDKDGNTKDEEGRGTAMTNAETNVIPANWK